MPERFLLAASALAIAAIFLGIAAGCRSAFITATLHNNSSAPLRLLEVDYPSASFGVNALAARATFPYRFKVEGSGRLKIQFTDSAGGIHTATGPELQQGEEGSLDIAIDSADKVSWKVTPRG